MSEFTAWINGDGPDPLYGEGKAAVFSSGIASIARVQRVLKIGFNRAARMIERMESEGLVSLPGHDGKRTILAKDEQAIG